MMKNVRLYVKGVALLRKHDSMGLVILTDRQEKRQISIPCSREVLFQIDNLVHSGKTNAEDVICVLWTIISEHVHASFEVHITGVRNGSYILSLFNSNSSKVYTMAASDALKLVLMAKLPIFICADLYEKQSVKFCVDKENMTIPVNVLTDELLENALENAIEKEDYELASVIKREIENRKQDNS